MISSVLLLGGLDLWLALNNTTGDTYSEIIAETSTRQSILPWAVGLIAGHWFWHGTRYTRWWIRSAAATALVGLLVGDFVFGITHPFLALVIGIISGRLVWASSPPSA